MFFYFFVNRFGKDPYIVSKTFLNVFLHAIFVCFEIGLIIFREIPQNIGLTGSGFLKPYARLTKHLFSLSLQKTFPSVCHRLL